MAEKLIKQIVNRLRNFGFVNVNEDNIATDEVYSQYFLKILNEKLGENAEADLVINKLLTAMNLKKEQQIHKYR
jgi:hypothetical protein